VILAELNQVEAGVELERVNVRIKCIQKIAAQSRLVPFVKIKAIGQVRERRRLDDNFH
jgi:hypothetical protein